MLGDVNLFLSRDDDHDHNDKTAPEAGGTPRVVAEIELMIAAEAQQGKGYGSAALRAFLAYVARHEGEIVAEFLGGEAASAAEAREGLRLAYLRVRVGEGNVRSLALFAGFGFERVGAGVSFFGEVEMRVWDGWRGPVEGYEELEYTSIEPILSSS
jgi:DNA polymerase delta subunit 2